ncbi:hypothetical protein GMOD_00008829 [Pyrenophora seminiperda CCB06]|uniref:Uncharacterized protein n=1 Tax=Pyrenophora seminiperda CCB06 TaxID=1302712 RepID=A0A3M7M658_9PLEO|nr:hypothetical protein GMOD_00008829 [Pyrenophora seminiperda CCB06]
MPRHFKVAFYAPADIYGRLVTDRVACSLKTRILRKAPEDPHATAERDLYRRQFVHTLSSAYRKFKTFSQKDAENMAHKFVALAQKLESSKAVGFLFGVESGVETIEATIENDLGKGAYTSASSTTKSLHEELLHPLLIALLSFQLGGPVNAAFTTHEHEWRLPVVSLTEDDLHTVFPSDSISQVGQPSTGLPTVYSEGDTGNLFDGLRLTRVWEQRDGKAVGPSGNHSVFMTGDVIPQPLVGLGAHDQDARSSPITILYDSSSVALYYDCQDPDAIRRAVTLDFHLNTLTDDMLRLLATPSLETSPELLTLSKLVTEFPILNYTYYFLSLLFTSESLTAMFTKLATITVPSRLTPSDNSQELRKRRFQTYKEDNWAHLPRDVKLMKSDICLKDTYYHFSSFMCAIVQKARRDVHLLIGMDLFPQDPIAENMECARKFIRDMPEVTISTRLSIYAKVFTATSFGSEDLISTRDMWWLSNKLESYCLEFTAFGFVGGPLQPSSIAALISALGDAIDCDKEVDIADEPWIEEVDLEIYRTRCLYFFWCVDLMARFLEERVMGPFMIDVETAETKAQHAQKVVHQMAYRLLRNWAAWAVFVDTLPKGGFHVRQHCKGQPCIIIPSRRPHA